MTAQKIKRIGKEDSIMRKNFEAKPILYPQPTYSERVSCSSGEASLFSDSSFFSSFIASTFA